MGGNTVNKSADMLKPLQSLNNYIGRFVPLLIIFIGFGTVCGAASFDCGKASTATEKAICANSELNAQDELLAKSLKQLLKKFPADKAAIMQGQRDWIKVQSLCDDNLDCLNWMYSDWFEKYTFNMSFADTGKIEAPTLQQSSGLFDKRTCGFHERKAEVIYSCSSSILDWDLAYRGCTFQNKVIEVKLSNSAAKLFVWNDQFSYLAARNHSEEIELSYISGGNPFGFSIEGENTSNKILPDIEYIYISPPSDFAGAAPVSKMGNGSSDWDIYEQEVFQRIPETTMFLVMFDNNIPYNCLSISRAKD